MSRASFNSDFLWIQFFWNLTKETIILLAKRRNKSTWHTWILIHFYMIGFYFIIITNNLWFYTSTHRSSWSSYKSIDFDSLEIRYKTKIRQSFHIHITCSKIKFLSDLINQSSPFNINLTKIQRRPYIYKIYIPLHI